MSTITVFSLCACVVLTSASYYNSQLYPDYDFNNDYNTMGFDNNYNSRYPVWPNRFQGFHQDIGQGIGRHGHHSRYRRSTYSQPRYQKNRSASRQFDRFGGSQFDPLGNWQNQYGYQNSYGNSGFNSQWNGQSMNNGFKRQFSTRQHW